MTNSPFNNKIKRLSRTLELLNKGLHLSTPYLVSQYKVSKKIIQTDFKEYILPLFDDDTVSYDYTSKKYRANRAFLQHTLLSSCELAIIAVIKNKSKDKYSDGDFSSQVDALFHKFEDELSNRVYQKSSVEKIDDFRKEIIQIKNAIANKNSIKCIYNNKQREIYPLSILNLEGYWYLVIYSPKESKIKTFHLNSIKNIETLDTLYKFDTQKVAAFDHAISAYFKPDNPPIPVQLFIDEKVAKYFLRKPLSSNQRVINSYSDGSIEIEVEITDFMEVVPTIQRYIPHVLVIEPKELHDQIIANIKIYEQKISPLHCIPQ